MWAREDAVKYAGRAFLFGEKRFIYLNYNKCLLLLCL